MSAGSPARLAPLTHDPSPPLGGEGRERGSGNVRSEIVRTVVVALGNPDRGDDGVGPAVIRELGSRPGVEAWEAIRGGLPLAQALVGFERALVVDASPSLPVGKMELAPLLTTGEASSLHGMGLAQALGALRAAGFPVPETWALAIGVNEHLPFGRGLSLEVSQAVPKAVAEVNRWLAN